jgi:hypothetical protein
MRKLRFIAMFAAIGLFIAGCSEELRTPDQNVSQELALKGKGGNGNGFPSGAHYNLNIIGVPKGKTADMNNNSGHRIFVSLQGNTKINLSEGDFQVLDANGTDGEASFQLPKVDVDCDNLSSYSVYARPLGAPGGEATIVTCATYDDPELGSTKVCSYIQYVATRTKGKSTATNVTKELLFIYVDLDGDGRAERYGLFDDALEDYFWSYDNNGLKILQLRFYDEGTEVPVDYVIQ